MEHEFSREEMLIGAEGLEKLERSRVMVFGIGGVGSHCTEALARGGIGRLALVDSDRVALTNINRQSIAFHSTLGQYKTRVMREKLLDINPRIQVITWETFVLEEEVKQLLETEKPDYVVDAVDTVTAKLALAEECTRREIPLISCMGTGNKLDPSMLRTGDIYQTSVCPLCRVMRRELKKRNIPRLKVVYSEEPPVKTGSAVPGSISFVPPAAGLLMAGQVIRDLLEQ